VEKLATLAAYQCAVVDEPGTGTSRYMEPMFNAWAGTAGVRLYPGTIYLCAPAPVRFPDRYIPLADFEHLHSAAHQRSRKGYSPRLYPVILASGVLAWVFRWSADDPGLGFVGNLGTCEANRLLEVIAPIGVKRAFGSLELSLRFIAA